MAAVTVSERVERAKDVLGRVLGYCETPEDDADYDRVRQRLFEAYRLAALIDSVVADLDVFGVRLPCHQALGRYLTDYRFHQTAYGIRLMERIKQNFERMVAMTKALDNAMTLECFRRKTYWERLDLVAAGDIIDIALGLGERFEELRDTEIVRRALTAA